MRTNLIALFIFLQAGAVAQWSPDPNTNNAICSYAGYQQNVQLVSDGSGGAILTWQDTRNSSTDIYAQRINALGVMQWPADGVAICNAAFEQINPRIVSDNSGGAIIVWQDDRNGAGAGNYDIYAQRIDAAGVVQWTMDGVAVCTISGIQNAQQIVTDGAGGAIIAWSDGRVGSANADIYAQRINGSGIALWTAGGATVCSASSLQNIPQLFNSGVGEAIISWEDWRNFSQADIYVQKISNGFTSWAFNGVVICSEPNFAAQYNTKIITDGSGGAIICWLDNRNFGSTTDIYAQRVNSSGLVQWTNNGIAVCTASRIQITEQMITDGSGGAIIAWEDRRDFNSDIYAQRINSSGIAQWTANGLPVCNNFDSQIEPQLISTNSGGAILTWTDSRNSGQPDIYAQSIDLAGAPAWAVNGVPVSSESHAQTTAQLIPDGAHGAIIAWQDLRSTTDYDIYGSRLFAAGTLPIHLIDFTVSNGISTVTLHWKTDNEINNRGYEIQRSRNGTDWSKVDFVAAKISSGNVLQYIWEDRLPLTGKSYYRLKQIDIDGKFAYTKVLPVNRIIPYVTTLIYPNPVRGMLQVNFGRTISTGNLQLYNNQGQLLLTQVITAQSSLQVNVKHFVSGMYTLKIKFPDGESIYKIMIE